MADRLLTLDQVSARTLIPINTLRFYRQVGKGPKSAKVGRRVVFRESDVERWIAEQFADEPQPA